MLQGDDKIVLIVILIIHQEPELTKPIIDKVFTKLFDQDVYVGEIFTHLGNDKSKDALKESAQELLDVLMNN